MKRLLILGVALAALAVDTDFNFTTSANASEMEKPRARPVARRAAPAVRPAQAPASNWTGGQAGGQGGGSSGAQSFVDPPSICPFGFVCPPTPFSFSGTPGSFTGGGFLGYRWQMGGMVVGVETDVSWKKLETTYSQNTFTLFGVSPRSEFFEGSIKQGWDASFRLRGGFLVTPWTLAYITGGLAIGEVSGSFTYNGALPGTLCGLVTCVAKVNESWNDTRVGGTVGVGLEQALGFGFGKSPLGGGLKARLEYRYTDFGKYSKTLGVASNCVAGVCTATSSTNVDLSAAFHKVTAGIGFDF